MLKYLIGGLLLAIIAFSQNAQSEVRHTYQGNPFDEIWEGGVFTTDHFVYGFVEFSSEPSIGEVFDESDLVDFSLSAGPLTLDPETPDVDIVVANFAFDGLGRIEYWDFFVRAELDGVYTSRIDDLIATDAAGSGDDSYGENNNLPGMWEPVPEPATMVMWLLVGATGGVIALRRRRTRS